MFACKHSCKHSRLIPCHAHCEPLSFMTNHSGRSGASRSNTGQHTALTRGSLYFPWAARLALTQNIGMIIVGCLLIAMTTAICYTCVIPCRCNCESSIGALPFTDTASTSLLQKWPARIICEAHRIGQAGRRRRRRIDQWRACRPYGAHRRSILPVENRNRVWVRGGGLHPRAVRSHRVRPQACRKDPDRARPPEVQREDAQTPVPRKAHTRAWSLGRMIVAAYMVVWLARTPSSTSPVSPHSGWQYLHRRIEGTSSTHDGGHRCAWNVLSRTYGGTSEGLVRQWLLLEPVAAWGNVRSRGNSKASVPCLGTTDLRTDPLRLGLYGRPRDTFGCKAVSRTMLATMLRRAGSSEFEDNGSDHRWSISWLLYVHGKVQLGPYW